MGCVMLGLHVDTQGQGPGLSRYAEGLLSWAGLAMHWLPLETRALGTCTCAEHHKKRALRSALCAILTQAHQELFPGLQLDTPKNPRVCRIGCLALHMHVLGS